MNDILEKSIKSGINGAKAMTIQVCSLMWLRTAMNYQYRYGTDIRTTFKTLYKEGGVRRFYRGVGPALFQGPLSRFSDTFSNQFALSIFRNNEALKNTPILIQTGFASFTSGACRIILMPIDTCKTIIQVEGKNGLNILKNKIKLGGVRVLYHGSLATGMANVVSHYPWFTTYNYLDKYLPHYESKLQTLARNASMGFCASIVSDSISNSLRVIKTNKQSYSVPISYAEITKKIIEKDGLIGLFGRGLKIRLMTNGIQASMFTVLWKYFNTKN